VLNAYQCITVLVWQWKWVSCYKNSCGKWLCDNTLILVYLNIKYDFSTLSSDVKGVSLLGKKEGLMETFELPGTVPVLYFNRNHNNSVSKQTNTLKRLGIFN